MIKQMSDEGHGKDRSHVTNVNDDVPPVVVSSLPADEDFPLTPECGMLMTSAIAPG